MSTNLTLDSLKQLSSQVGYNHMASCLNEISAMNKLNLQERFWKESCQFEHMTNWGDAGHSCRSTDFLNCEKERSNSHTYDMQRLNREMLHPPLWSLMICRMLFTKLRPSMSIFKENLHTGISFICKGEKGCKWQLEWILCCLWSSWKKNLRKFTLESSLVLVFATLFSWRVDRKSFSCGVSVECRFDDASSYWCVAVCIFLVHSNCIMLLWTNFSSLLLFAFAPAFSFKKLVLLLAPLHHHEKLVLTAVLQKMEKEKLEKLIQQVIYFTPN